MLTIAAFLAVLAVLPKCRQAAESTQRHRRSHSRINDRRAQAREVPRRAQTQEDDVWPALLELSGQNLPLSGGSECCRLEVNVHNASAYLKAVHLLLRRHGQDLANDLSNTCRDSTIWYSHVMAENAHQIVSYTHDDRNAFDDVARAMLMRVCRVYVDKIAQNFANVDAATQRAIQAGFLWKLHRSSYLVYRAALAEKEDCEFKYLKYTQYGAKSYGRSLAATEWAHVSEYFPNIEQWDRSELQRALNPAIHVPLEMTIYGIPFI